MTEKQHQAAQYVKAIRNTYKHAYALAYLRFLNGASSEPTAPEQLSCMAAQAVRMQLHSILDKADKEEDAAWELQTGHFKTTF